jgi:glycosyltransferase involved in cell wall biosynthesis
MMHIFLNAAGASAGSGLTYLYNVVPRLSSSPNVRTTVAVQGQLRAELRHLGNVNVLEIPIPASSLRRFWFEQKQLPRLIRAVQADVLLSAGNFAVRNSPVPQILLSGNSLYTSKDFYRDLRHRGEYGMWLDTKIRGVFAKKSVQWADCTVAPSHAFANELQRWTGRQVSSIHHGFDPGVFFGDKSLARELTEKLQAAEGCLKLLFVSHYNYYRNFETLFRALALLRKQAPDRKLRLFLTCTLEDEKTPGTYKTREAARMIRDLGIREDVVELGAVPYRQLHHVYKACDIYVTPAYTETFAHPLVEAMACGLPVIASDIPAHREICEMGLFFDRFSPEQLAQRVLEIAPRRENNRVLHHKVGFSWSDHVSELLTMASGLKTGIELGNQVEQSSLEAAC